MINKKVLLYALRYEVCAYSKISVKQRKDFIDVLFDEYWNIREQEGKSRCYDDQYWTEKKYKMYMREYDFVVLSKTKKYFAGFYNKDMDINDIAIFKTKSDAISSVMAYLVGEYGEAISGKTILEMAYKMDENGKIVLADFFPVDDKTLTYFIKESRTDY